MKTMGVRELKARMSEAIREVKDGETIEVTCHGEVVAWLVPAPNRRIEPDKDSAERSAALASLDALAAQIARYANKPTDVTELLSEMRR